MIDVVAIFREAGIEEKTIFYGLDEIVSTNIIWKVFALIKRLSPSFVQFYEVAGEPDPRRGYAGRAPGPDRGTSPARRRPFP